MTQSVPSGFLHERELVRRAVDDPEAFGALYQAHVDGIYRYCYRRLQSREAAEDATQVVFERALGALSRYRHEEPFRAWLYTIAHNEVVDQLRRTRVSAPIDDMYTLHDPHPTPEEEALVHDEGAQLRRLIAQLSEQERQLIDLRLAGLNDREIAVVLGISHGAVRTRQYRALQQLRSLSMAYAGGGRINVEQ